MVTTYTSLNEQEALKLIPLSIVQNVKELLKLVPKVYEVNEPQTLSLTSNKQISTKRTTKYNTSER